MSIRIFILIFTLLFICNKSIFSDENLHNPPEKLSGIMIEKEELPPVDWSKVYSLPRINFWSPTFPFQMFSPGTGTDQEFGRKGWLLQEKFKGQDGNLRFTVHYITHYNDGKVKYGLYCPDPGDIMKTMILTAVQKSCEPVVFNNNAILEETKDIHNLKPPVEFLGAFYVLTNTCYIVKDQNNRIFYFGHSNDATIKEPYFYGKPKPAFTDAVKVTRRSSEEKIIFDLLKNNSIEKEKLVILTPDDLPEGMITPAQLKAQQEAQEIKAREDFIKRANEVIGQYLPEK